MKKKSLRQIRKKRVPVYDKQSEQSNKTILNDLNKINFKNKKRFFWKTVEILGAILIILQFFESTSIKFIYNYFSSNHKLVFSPSNFVKKDDNSFLIGFTLSNEGTEDIRINKYVIISDYIWQNKIKFFPIEEMSTIESSEKVTKEYAFNAVYWHPYNYDTPLYKTLASENKPLSIQTVKIEIHFSIDTKQYIQKIDYGMIQHFRDMDSSKAFLINNKKNILYD